MADKSKIEWTDATWNPITGCSVVSSGCTNCYAMKLAGTRMRHHWSRRGLTQATKAGPVWNGQLNFNLEWLPLPMAWTRPRRIFVNAHGDTFHESAPDEWIDKIFAVMALCPQHTFQVLTKRSARMREWFASPGLNDRLGKAVIDLGYDGPLEVLRWPLPNVWLGVSCEDQERADARIPDLLATPAAVRFISAEPLLGAIDITGHLWGRAEPCADCPKDADCSCGMLTRRFNGEPTIDWVIVGGESGPSARPMNPEWARELRDQCAEAQVHFHFKQWGEWGFDPRVGEKQMRGDDQPYAIDERWSMIKCGKKNAGRTLDGVTHDGMPAEVRP